MAVYTCVPESALVSFLLLYDLGELLSFEGIEAGVSNTNYKIRTTCGLYILTLFEPHRVKEEDIPFFIDYAVSLKDGGVLCPETLVQKSGARVSELEGRPAAIFSFLQGEGATAATLTPLMCEGAGRLLGKMHRIAERPCAPVKANNFGPVRWHWWVEKYAGRMNMIEDGLRSLVEAEMAWFDGGLPHDLARGTIHGDFFPDNVFFIGDDVSGVFDFHFACSDVFVYDLAIALNAWSFDASNSFIPARMDALLRGYERIRPLDEAERQALPLFLRAAALRFLLSRIEEKLNWTPDVHMIPHDPLVFAARLRWFQQYSLLPQEKTIESC